MNKFFIILLAVFIFFTGRSFGEKNNAVIHLKEYLNKDYIYNGGSTRYAFKTDDGRHIYFLCYGFNKVSGRQNTIFWSFDQTMQLKLELLADSQWFQDISKDVEKIKRNQVEKNGEDLKVFAIWLSLLKNTKTVLSGSSENFLWQNNNTLSPTGLFNQSLNP